MRGNSHYYNYYLAQTIKCDHITFDSQIRASGRITSKPAHHTHTHTHTLIRSLTSVLTSFLVAAIWENGCSSEGTAQTVLNSRGEMEKSPH